MHSICHVICNMKRVSFNMKMSVKKGQYIFVVAVQGRFPNQNLLKYGGRWLHWTGGHFVQASYRENAMVIIVGDV